MSAEPKRHKKRKRRSPRKKKDTKSSSPKKQRSKKRKDSDKRRSSPGKMNSVERPRKELTREYTKATMSSYAKQLDNPPLKIEDLAAEMKKSQKKSGRKEYIKTD
jgi:hypothetical protein